MSARNEVAAAPRAQDPRTASREQRATRLAVHRTNAHIYAQIIAPTGDKVLASASTLEEGRARSCKNGGNKAAAAVVGKRIAEKAKARASRRSRSTARASGTTAA